LRPPSRLFFHARMGLEAAGPGVPTPDSLAELSRWHQQQVARLEEPGAEGPPPRARVFLTGQSTLKTPLEHEDREVVWDEEAPPTADGNTGGDAAVASSATSKSPPGRGEALQCAMDEESMPDGVEWVGGVVTRVNTEKKTFQVRVTSNAHSWSHLSPSSSSSPLFCPLLHKHVLRHTMTSFDSLSLRTHKIGAWIHIHLGRHMPKCMRHTC